MKNCGERLAASAKYVIYNEFFIFNVTTGDEVGWLLVSPSCLLVILCQLVCSRQPALRWQQFPRTKSLTLEFQFQYPNVKWTGKPQSHWDLYIRRESFLQSYSPPPPPFQPNPQPIFLWTQSSFTPFIFHRTTISIRFEQIIYIDGIFPPSC